jgi:hypothetical protein
MDELLLPQRKLKSMKISTKTSTNSATDFAVIPPVSRPPPQTMYEKGVAGGEYVAKTSGAARDMEPPRVEFVKLITTNECPIQIYCSSRNLVALAAVNKTLRRYLLRLNFNYKVRFHDFASIIRARRGFGIFDSCGLHIGEGTTHLIIETIPSNLIVYY